jgi:MFS family permease
MLKPLHLQVFLSSCNHTAVNAMRLTVLLYAASLDASPALIGLLAALHGLVSAFMAVAMGKWIDRIGPRFPFMLASVALAACGVAAWALPGIPTLIVVCPLVGIFNSMFHIGSHQSVGRFGKSEERTSNFALYSIGISAATFAGPMLAGLSVDHLGHGHAFLAIALVSALPLVILGPGLIRYPERTVATKEEKSEVKGGWGMLRDPDLRAAYVVGTMNNCLWSLVSFMIPLLGTQIGFSATRIGTLMAFLATGAIGVRVAMAFLIRSVPRWNLVLAAQSMMFAGFAGMPFTEVYALLGVCAFLVGLGLGLAGPLATTLMYDASPPERVAEVVGMRMTVANVGQTGAPLLSGAAGAALGVAPVFWAVAAVVAVDVWMNRHRIGQGRANRTSS